MNKVLGALGAVALGAAAMYVLDPKSGRRRRALIKDKAVSLANKEADMIAKTGRHLRNRAKGARHKIPSAVQEATSETGRLTEQEQ